MQEDSFIIQLNEYLCIFVLVREREKKKEKKKKRETGRTMKFIKNN